MSIEETGQAEQAVTKAAPLLQTLGDPAAAVCVDGFCAIPATNASATKTRGADK